MKNQGLFVSLAKSHRDFQDQSQVLIGVTVLVHIWLTKQGIIWIIDETSLSKIIQSIRLTKA